MTQAAIAASKSQQGHATVLRLKTSEVDFQTQGDQQAGKESQGGRKARSRTPELRGGC
jgi:hypothetical protein